MRKRVILSAAVLFVTGTVGTIPAQAQFLKKLGKALDKVANAGNKKSDDSKVRQIGETVKNDNITMTAKGISPVEIGVKVSALPQQVAGLYDKVTSNTEEDMDGDVMTYLTFTLGGQPKLTATADSDGVIWQVSTESADVVVYVNGNPYKVGDKIATLKRERGVRADDDYGFAACYGDIDVNEDTNGTICSFSIGRY